MKTHEKNAQFDRLIFIILTYVFAAALGGAFTLVIMSKTAMNAGSVLQTGTPAAVVQYNDNPCAITFVLTEPIAPDFYVGFGCIGSGYSMYVDDPKFDPMGVGVDRALSLISQIRYEVPGVTEDVYARGHTLDIHIAESYLPCRDKIVEQVLAIIEGGKDCAPRTQNAV